MHGAENGRERAMVYIGSWEWFTRPRHWPDSTIPTAASTVWKTELYRFPGTPRP